MSFSRRLVGSIVGILTLCSVSFAQSSVQTPASIANWPTAPYWSPTTPIQPSGGSDPELARVGIESVPTSPLPFVAINPCRLVDTRGNGFAGQYGPPALAAGSPRNFTLTGQCGIPNAAQAVSLNVTVTTPQGPGFILIYPQGGSQPSVSTLNYVAGQTIANAAIVPLGNFGITVIAGVSGTHLIIDANGYYAGGAGMQNTFLGFNAGNFTLSGSSNTGIGVGALAEETTGSENTAVGFEALSDNGTGVANTAVGLQALLLNGSGGHNTGVGDRALAENSTGSSNTAVGADALSSAGTNNNVAVGFQALANASGGGNIALGSGAGVFNMAGGFNMYLGNEGVATESTTIRIGSGSQHTRMFVAGVLTSAISGTPVLISNTGQLGIATSSARYKEEIRDMGNASDRLLGLRPVTFRYKGHPDDPTQFGLVAEEVEKVLPELVFRDSAGRPESVLYNELPPMLLNEVQKQRRRIESQDEEIATLRKRLELLETRLAPPTN